MSRNLDDINGKFTGGRNENNVKIRIETWTIRILYKFGVLQNITEVIEKHKIPLVVIRKPRWTVVRSIRSNNSTIFYSGTKNKRHEKGVDFVVSEKIMPYVKSFVTINEQICFIYIVRSKCDLIIVNCNAPIEEKEEKEKNIFYEDLEGTFVLSTKKSYKNNSWGFQYSNR